MANFYRHERFQGYHYFYLCLIIVLHTVGVCSVSTYVCKCICKYIYKCVYKYVCKQQLSSDETDINWKWKW